MIVLVFLVVWSVPLLMVGWLAWDFFRAEKRRRDREDAEVEALDALVPEGWSPEARDLIRAYVGGGFRL